jgi:hypothetical protein
MRRRIHAADCMSVKEEDTCMSYEEEDTCMSVKEEDTCESSKTSNTSAKHTRSEPSRLPGRPPEGPAGGAPGGVPRSADFLRDRYLRDFWIFLLFLSYEEEDTYLADGRAEIRWQLV